MEISIFLWMTILPTVMRYTADILYLSHVRVLFLKVKLIYYKTVCWIYKKEEKVFWVIWFCTKKKKNKKNNFFIKSFKWKRCMEILNVLLFQLDKQIINLRKNRHGRTQTVHLSATFTNCKFCFIFYLFIKIFYSAHTHAGYAMRQI